MFLRHFPNLSERRVLDLGGRLDFWVQSGVRPRQVDIVNLYEGNGRAGSWYREVKADACDPSAELGGVHYDLVFSNSLIEHLGGHARRLEFAATVIQSADAYWIQTPYKYFPIEPHWIFPFFQFLPLALQARVSCSWPLMHTKQPTQPDGVRAALGVELMDKTAMRYYFSGAQLLVERFLGLPKSLIAVRSGQTI